MKSTVEVFIIVEGRKFTVEQFLAFRQRIGTIRGSDQLSAAVKKRLNNAYKYFSDVTDSLIANAVGASQIKALSGRGFQADFVSIDNGNVDISEAKSIKVLLENESLLANKISLGNLSLRTTSQIATKGVELTNTGYVQATEQFAITDTSERESFINNLISRSSQERKKYLNELSLQNTAYGRAAKQIITNIEVKASKIYVSAPTPTGGSVIRQIGWTWKDILNNPAAAVRVSKDGELDVIFSEKLVSDALNNATKTVEYKKLTEAFAKEINDIIAKAQFSSDIFRSLEDFDLTLKKDIKYVEGSVKVYQAKISEKTAKKRAVRRQSSAQKVISDAQFTALVQKDVEKRMPKGPLRGPPLSPTILTYRTGTFVNSIEVIQNLRQKLMTYYYAPNYKIHERKGARAPRLLLQASIRATVQQVYSEKFRILRGF
jgi:hypothetical protein